MEKELYISFKKSINFCLSGFNKSILKTFIFELFFKVICISC